MKAIAALSSMMMAGALAGEVINDSISLGGGNRQVTWYVPDNEPSGWVYLQHGFSRNKRNVASYATRLMDEGVLVLAVQLSVTGGAPDLARAVGKDIAAGNVETPNGVTLPDRLVISGHSAGGLYSTVLGATLVEEGFSGLAGEVLLDPVDANNLMSDALGTMSDAGVPILSIIAAPGSCNSQNNAVGPLNELSGFTGFRIVGGAHTDAEGPSSDFLGRLFCGTPQSDNVAILQDFGSTWTTDLLSGSASSDYYPGGAAFDQLVSEGEIELYT